MLIRNGFANCYPLTPSDGIFRKEFGLDDDEYNAWLAARIVADPAYADGVLPECLISANPAVHRDYRCRSQHLRDGGRIYLLVNATGSTPRIEHHLRYRVRYVRWLKSRVVSDVQVWTRGHIATGYHSHLVFNELLARHGVVATDGLRAEDSERFWYGRIHEAIALGLPLAMADFRHNCAEPYDPVAWPAFQRQSRRSRHGISHYLQAYVLIGHAGLKTHATLAVAPTP